MFCFIGGWYNLTYDYNLTSSKKTNNKLNYITDLGEDIPSEQDIETQLSTNYDYDAKGRMIQDLKNNVALISWTAYDKVKEVVYTQAKTDGSTGLRFSYDPMGKRILKEKTFANSSLNERTYYVYDASGNLIFTYKKRALSANGPQDFRPAEQYIYGSKRLGYYNCIVAATNFDEVWQFDNTQIIVGSATEAQKEQFKLYLNFEIRACYEIKFTFFTLLGLIM